LSTADETGRGRAVKEKGARKPDAFARRASRRGVSNFLSDDAAALLAFRPRAAIAIATMTSTTAAASTAALAAIAMLAVAAFATFARGLATLGARLMLAAAATTATAALSTVKAAVAATTASTAVMTMTAAVSGVATLAAIRRAGAGVRRFGRLVAAEEALEPAEETARFLCGLGVRRTLLVRLRLARFELARFATRLAGLEGTCLAIFPVVPVVAVVPVVPVVAIFTRLTRVKSALLARGPGLPRFAALFRLGRGCGAALGAG
jgi:hypothetical protein